MPGIEPNDLLHYTLSDPSFYEPASALTPLSMAISAPSAPLGWDVINDGIWSFHHSGGDLPQQGWKVHVSSTLGRAGAVLEKVAAACFDFQTSFKHIRDLKFFILLHHKYASRYQSGKFCTIYPGTIEMAREIMERLAYELQGEPGPHILTDRRYKDSMVVHYRYGGFEPRYRLRSDGTREPLISDLRGVDVPDQRQACFTLPDGIADPFQPASGHAAIAISSVQIGNYCVNGAIRYCNAGGVYSCSAIADADTSPQRQMIIKEARGHNGLDWLGADAQTRLRHEYEVLLELQSEYHLAPHPVDYFREWENEYLVMEQLDGISLSEWITVNHPARRSGGYFRQAELFKEYYRRCLIVYQQVSDRIDRLHCRGWRFGDLSPDNIFVGAADKVCLIDFECATRVTESPLKNAGTPGYMPDVNQIRGDCYAHDSYGLAAIARALIFPYNEIIQLQASNYDLIIRDLECMAPIPHILREVGAEYLTLGIKPELRLTSVGRTRDSGPRSETTEQTHENKQVAAEVREIASGIVADLLESPDYNRAPLWRFPASFRGFESNTECLLYGTAGVLHALACYDRDIVPPDLIDAFRDRVLNADNDLPPGLFSGWSGISCLLAQFGFVEEAITCLDRCGSISNNADNSLAFGRAGMALATAYVGRAALSERLIARALDSAAQWSAPANTNAVTSVGLLTGSTGVALALHHMFQLTKERKLVDCGRRMLRNCAEADMPYLAHGSAGLLSTLVRYARCDAESNDVFKDTIRSLLIDCSKNICPEAGLCIGQAGLAFALADFERWAKFPEDAKFLPLDLALALRKHCISVRQGIRVLGEARQRYSADLWSGSAGLLLAISHILGGTGVPLFLFDDPHPELNEHSGGGEFNGERATSSTA
jgi:hypothetical protein